MIRLHKVAFVKTEPFICTNCAGTVTNLKIHGTVDTYYDEFVFERSIADPSIASTCNDYPYCDINVNFRQKCSDMIRNVKYTLLLEPAHNVVETCKNFFDYESFGSYSLTYQQEQKIQTLDWDNYCLFYESINNSQYYCNNKGYEFY